jgi:hypothetical protein
MAAGRISIPPEADLKKQGQSGSSRFLRDRDAGAPREASDSCLCERGKPADEPESPPYFSNEIRPVMKHGRML